MVTIALLRTKKRLPALAALLAALILLAAPRAHAGARKQTWKPVSAALLKLNNHPVKTWDVLQDDKNHHLLLVQVDRDWYVFNLKKKRLYRVKRSDFESRGVDLVGPEPDRHTPEVKTRGWDSHDIGPAQQITVRLAEGGDVLAIELPHPLVVY